MEWLEKGGGMDDNYLMRKEGLTMTNEDSVNTSLECEPGAVSGPPKGTQQPQPPTPSLGHGFPAWQEPGVPRNLCGTSGWWFWCPIPNLGPRDGEQAVSIVGTGWKNRREELLGSRKREKKKKNLVKWRKEKDMGKINVLDISRKRSKCQQWRRRSRSEKTWRPRKEKGGK